MGTTWAWKIHQVDIPDGDWKAEEMPASVEAVDLVLANGLATAEGGRTIAIAVFDGDFGYLGLVDGSQSIRFVVNRELAAGTEEGLQAIDAAGSPLEGSSAFVWQGEHGVMSAEAVISEVEAVTERGDLEGALVEVLELLAVKDVVLTAEDEPLFTIGRSPLESIADQVASRYFLRYGTELVPVEIVDRQTGKVMAALGDVGAAMAEVARLNGVPVLESRDPRA
jgi:hypothetical protein